MSKFRDIPVMHNYFCAKHGKAEADGAIGHLSMHLDAVVRSGSQEFSDAGEIVRYCNLKLRVHNPDDAMCCHWQQHYFEAIKIFEDRTLAAEWNCHGPQYSFNLQILITSSLNTDLIPFKLWSQFPTLFTPL